MKARCTREYFKRNAASWEGLSRPVLRSLQTALQLQRAARAVGTTEKSEKKRRSRPSFHIFWKTHLHIFEKRTVVRLVAPSTWCLYVHAKNTTTPMLWLDGVPDRYSIQYPSNCLPEISDHVSILRKCNPNPHRAAPHNVRATRLILFSHHTKFDPIPNTARKEKHRTQPRSLPTK